MSMEAAASPPDIGSRSHRRLSRRISYLTGEQRSQSTPALYGETGSIRLAAPLDQGWLPLSRPRSVLPNRTYLVTRRCLQRQFLLLPSPIVNAVFLYCLAYAAGLFEVKIHAFCVLSNHFHLVLTDTKGILPRFMQWLDGTLARCLNSHYGRLEYFWAPGTYNRVELIDPEDILEKMVYTLTNPVAAGLVSEGKDWPGLRSSTLEEGSQKISSKMPGFFFRKEGKLSAIIDFSVTLPESVAQLQSDASCTLLKDAVLEKEREIRDQFRHEGRKFAGRQRILLQKPTDSPAMQETRWNLNPQVAGKDKWRRKERLQLIKTFLRRYREALEKFKTGIRDVVFPAGTYWLRIHCGVLCHDPPSN